MQIVLHHENLLTPVLSFLVPWGPDYKVVLSHYSHSEKKFVTFPCDKLKVIYNLQNVVRFRRVRFVSAA